jgi:hypothetical protein
MLRPLLFLLAGLAAGFALSAWLRPQGAGLGGGRHQIASAELADRVAALEDTLHGERAQVAALAAEVSALRERLQTSASGADPVSGAGEDSAAARGNGEAASARTAAASAPADAEARPGAEDAGPRFRGPGGFGRPGFGGADESRIDRFVAAGFSADRAAYLDRRASELRMQALEAEYEAARSGKPADPAAENPEQALRGELGDADYERYLQALGRPTRVGVRGVLASSPAEKAGLQPGDEITSYAGRRVFDVNELSRLTYEGQAGETVAVDVVRNGQPMQIYVQRGPLGITGGRGRFGGRP